MVMRDDDVENHKLNDVYPLATEHVKKPSIMNFRESFSASLIFVVN